VTTPPLLQVEDLWVRFPGRTGTVEAVRGISFEMGREKLGIVGESGSGKTVTGRAILGLVSPPGRVTARRLRLDGEDLLGMAEAGLRRIRGRRISMVMQDPKFSLNPVMTVGRQIAEAYRVHTRASPAEARRRTLDMLAAVRIRHPERVYDLYPHEVSGGMGQRVMIAMMLIPEPDLVIADEPTSALDVSTQKSVIKLLFDLLDEGIVSSMLFITHELPLLRHVSSSIAVMYAGEFVEMGTTEQIIYDGRQPYTKALMGSMLSAEPGQRGKKPVAIEGAPPNLARAIAGCRFAERCPTARPECRTHEQSLRVVRERQVRCEYAD
jgi:peptide/nickel transport system ATP-binding protein